jgi:tripartite-type tricarboxylate transporter receptor subunit TctC
VLEQADVHTRLAAIGIDVASSTPEELRAQILSDYDKWTKVLTDANIKPE